MENLFTPQSISWWDMLTRLGAAAVFAFLLGLERYTHKKPIDFRPFVIIAVISAALLIALTEFAIDAEDGTFSIDPGKVFNGILTGIGFLGAGALFRDENVVRGAGSAAAIWASGGIGIICGLGYIWLAGVVAAGFALLLYFSAGLPHVHEAEDYDGKGDREDKEDRD